jgi:hypothetical protein
MQGIVSGVEFRVIETLILSCIISEQAHLYGRPEGIRDSDKSEYYIKCYRGWKQVASFGRLGTMHAQD